MLIGVFGLIDIGQTLVTAIFGGLSAKAPTDGSPTPEDITVIAGINCLNNIWIYINYFYYGFFKKGFVSNADGRHQDDRLIVELAHETNIHTT